MPLRSLFSWESNMPAPHPRDMLRDDMYKTLLQIPIKMFMYHIDQIASMLDVTELTMKKNMLYYQGRERRKWTQDDLVAVNISRVNAPPEWRISEEEFMRWMKYKGIKFVNPRKQNVNRITR